MKSDIKDILLFVDELKELDVSGVEPLVQLYETEGELREDEVISSDWILALKKNAPEWQDDHIVVPETV